nr:hypothetical protein BaRGS_022873 [Batillaria attramentaria]
MRDPRKVKGGGRQKPCDDNVLEIQAVKKFVANVDRPALCQDLDIPPTADPVDYCLCSDNMSDASTPHRLALIHTAPDLAYLAGPPGTGKTLTAVIMGVEWMRQNKTVNILSGDRESRAAAHHIKQQLEETARLVIGPQAASRALYPHCHVRLCAAALEPASAPTCLQHHVTEMSGPGHEERDTRDCETCGREVGRILTQVLHVGQGGNPSSSSTTTTALQYRDVFVLSWGDLHDDVRNDAGHVTRPANGVVRGLRQAGVP